MRALFHFRISAFPAILTVLIAGACNNAGRQFFLLTAFNPAENMPSKDGIYYTHLDFTNAIDSGFMIPSMNLDGSDWFHFSFKIKNQGSEPSRFAYKLYYQNESYKFDELRDSSLLVADNFYGSWEDPSELFRFTPVLKSDEEILVTDSFRIIGNPRNESRFYGTERKDKYLSIHEVQNQMKYIMDTPEWMSSIRDKAKKNKISDEKQLYEDAVFILLQHRSEKNVNQRWKRNPRAGIYSAMLIVMKEDEIMNIPETVANISIADSAGYTNPYSFFMKLQDESPTNVIISKRDFLRVNAQLPVQKGIYVNSTYYKSGDFDQSCMTTSCGSDSVLYHNAPFEQYIHQLENTGNLNNIPILADVAGNAYSVEAYHRNSSLPDENRYKIPVATTACPCSNVKSDMSDSSVVLINTAGNHSDPQKENTGVVARHGLTYGKFRVKVYLPRLLNDYNVWNGLTNAVWLINEDQADWNQRRSCIKDGYIRRTESGNPKAERQQRLSYSEIDFEMIKATSNWPETSYNIKNPASRLPDLKNDEILITCTNWDMACSDPLNFHVGAKDFIIGGKKNTLHRWDHWYAAITTKIPVKDAEVFGRDYYFEIEWLPKEIIWRVGPHPDSLREVARMDETVTSIPNNQMVLTVTQEFHLSEWWPGQPFDQNNIPFPLKNITGKVKELVIE